MPTWVPPAVALSLVVVAVCTALVTAAALIAALVVRARVAALAGELAHLRADLQPTLDAVRHLAEKGVDVAEMANDEAKEIVDTTRRIRYDLERGVRHAKRRLAEFDAVIGVVQDEVEATALDVTSALSTARQGAGMIGRLRRLIRPRRRGRW